MKTSTWQLQTAKNKFSEVVERALTSGPQTITRRGKKTVVVVDYDHFKQSNKSKKDFKDVLMSVDLSELDLRRDRSDTTGRATPFKLV